MDGNSLLEFVHTAVVAAALRFHHLLGLVHVIVGQPAHRTETVHDGHASEGKRVTHNDGHPPEGKLAQCNALRA